MCKYFHLQDSFDYSITIYTKDAPFLLQIQAMLVHSLPMKSRKWLPCDVKKPKTKWTLCHTLYPLTMTSGLKMTALTVLFLQLSSIFLFYFLTNKMKNGVQNCCVYVFQSIPVDWVCDASLIQFPFKIRSTSWNQCYQ